MFVGGKESLRRAGKGEKERIKRKGVIKTLLIQRIMEAPSSPTASRNVHWALNLVFAKVVEGEILYV